MIRTRIVFFSVCLILGACTQRMICPAYQSAYIYDKDELRKKFSYFKEDSTPKILTASKNKYLVADPITYRKKIRSMQTVAVKSIPVHVPDSLTSNADSVSMADLDRAARSVIDSTFIVDVPKKDTATTKEDSIYVITKDKELRLLKYDGPDSLIYDAATQKYVAEKARYYVQDVRYNVQEDNYMWYLRDNLVLPDVRIAKKQSAENRAEKAGDKKKGVGLKGFFKNLFKKKKKAEIDSTAVDPNTAPKEEFDYIDEADTVAQTDGQQPEKVKRKSFLKKKPDSEKTPRIKKKKTKKAKAEEDPIIQEKKKEDDDGF
jgi:hypothetical protein